MAGIGNFVQKAFFMGVGLASYAGEKATTKFQELRSQAEKLADEMVKRGEMTADEASKFVDELVKQAQQQAVESPQPNNSQEPRRIEILDDEESASSSATSNSGSADNLRAQVQALQDELRRLQRD
ncbi:hypothetical protein [Oscillatoria sp. FACHB-1406]|uniref:phasin family protein n=1 Tax=Oscillatoria sp. FACHB-1406 TaxID=2692846 RepID=UPI0016841CAE|nr:hypothetical protein [Oscillatoria sp. FACHB-1406]MBD2580193.1 hypothetical protein [Oscillatoria sp. FACHB-1406]